MASDCKAVTVFCKTERYLSRGITPHKKYLISKMSILLLYALKIENRLV